MQTGKAISIPSILKVGNGTLNKIGEYLKSEELTSVVIFMGNGLIDMFGDAIMKSLADADITVLEYSQLDTVDKDDIIICFLIHLHRTAAAIAVPALQAVKGPLQPLHRGELQVRSRTQPAHIPAG